MSFAHYLSFTRTAMATLLATTLTAGLTGCGSSGGGSSSTTIDGSVFASSVSGASCGIYTGPDEMVGSTFTTSETGTFSVDIPNGKLADVLVLFCEGGTYTDEVDGSTQTAGDMAAYAEGGTLADGVSLNATPGSTIIFQLITDYDMTPAEAEAAFDTAFGYTPDITATPTDATKPAMGSSLAAIQAGLRAATFSQLTSDLGLNQNQQFELLTALAMDLSDGTADGVMLSGGVNIPGTSTALQPLGTSFTDAMDNFRTRTVTTSSYKISYLKKGMSVSGKNNFLVNITDLDGAAQAGLTVSLMPMMYMADITHTTPVDGCTDSGNGFYDCTIYYVMASKMMDGMSMGEWDLKVMADGEAAHFYPEVMMAMGDTPVDMQKNSNLTMTMNEMTSARTFQIFKSELTGWVGNHTFELFISTMETMMSFPAVDTSVTLNEGTMNALPIDSMIVEVSVTPTFDVIHIASENGSGYWTATITDGLADDTSGQTLYVRVTINGNILNKDPAGLLVDGEGEPTGANEYGTFSVTTPASAT